MAQFAVRPASVDDARATAELFAAVAEERDAIATEPPVDVEERTALFARTAAGTVVAVADGRVIGMLHVDVSRHGFGEFGMLVDRDWRGRGARLGAGAGDGRMGARSWAAQALPGGVRAQFGCDRPVPQVRLHGGRAAHQAVPARQR